MRLKLALSPWWVQGLAYGLFFGAAMTAFSRYRTGEWLPAAAGGLVGGALFGIFMGLYMSKLNRRLLGEVAKFSPAEQRAVLRGSWRGHVPTDPDQLAAAITLLRRRRASMVQTRRWSVCIFVIAIFLYVFLALTQSAWWWFCAAMFLAFLILTVTTVPRMDKRLALLEGASEREQ